METYQNYPNYEVSSLGNIKSLDYGRTKKPRLLRPAKNALVYLFVVLYNNRKPKVFKVHQLQNLYYALTGEELTTA